MLQFNHYPDSFFYSYLEELLKFKIYCLSGALDSEDLDSEGVNELDSFVYDTFEREMIEAFGGGKRGVKLLKTEIGKLLFAFKSPDLYRMTPWHKKIIYRIMTSDNEIETIVEKFHDEDRFVIDGREINDFNFDKLIEVYFGDTDFIMPVEKALSENVTGPGCQNYCIGSSLNILVDKLDLTLEKIIPRIKLEEADLTAIYSFEEEDKNVEAA